MTESERLVLSGDRALGLYRQSRKRPRILHRNVGEYLAIQFDPGRLQPMNELVVTHPVQFGRRSNAHNPQRPKLPLPLLPPRVSELETAFDGLFGGAVEFRFGEEVAAGAL